MDLSLLPEQEMLREEVHRFCREKFQKKSSAQNGLSVNREHWQAFASLGWLGVLLPEDVCGTQGSIIDASIILEEFGRNLVTEPFLPCAILAAKTINNATNAALRSSLLGAMVKGELIAVLAHTEAEARGNIGFVETSARRNSSGEYVLRGNKTGILAGPMADKFAVSARVENGTHTSGGIAVFILDRGAPGMCCRDYYLMDGRAAADLTLNEVTATPEMVLIAENCGLSPIEDATDFAITGLCAEAVGGMNNVIKVTAEYLKTRRAYGTTLSKFQALQHRLADMLVELELSRSMLYSAFAAFSESNQRKRRQLISSAKALIGHSAKLIAAYGIQLHGAQGMAGDYVVGQHFKQLTVIEGLFGNSDFHWKQCASGCEDGLLQSFDAQDPRETEKTAPTSQRWMARSDVPATETVP
jgi:alkylation response protein AidB-like acyl-CoA dehydrogenase